MVGGWPLIHYSKQVADLTLWKEAWYYGDNYNSPSTCFRTRDNTRNKEINHLAANKMV